MIIDSNAHTHTTFCDGKNTPEEMVEAAVRLGFTSLGFSGHSTTTFPEVFSGVSDMEGYIAEICRLKEAYRGRLDIYLGIEEDLCFPVDRGHFDYIIGAVHYIKDKARDLYYPVDNTAEDLERCIEEIFRGDAMALAEKYYQHVVEAAKLRPDILAHFDLVTKLNSNNRYFNEKSPLYRDLALWALEEAAKCGCIFEVNSGGMFRGFTKFPYPAEFLLKRLKELKAPVTLSSDSHGVQSLNYYFDEMLRMLVGLGFKEITLLGKGGFYTKPI